MNINTKNIVIISSLAVLALVGIQTQVQQQQQQANAQRPDYSQGLYDGRITANSDFRNGFGFNIKCDIDAPNDWCLGFKIGYTQEWTVLSLK